MYVYEDTDITINPLLDSSWEFKQNLSPFEGSLATASRSSQASH